MSLTTFDTCIIGQGLAGTALAWELHRQGQRVAVVEHLEQSSSSRIAAGLITPITGKRFVKSWRFDQFWKAAVTFYREIETMTDSSFFHQQNSIRLFTSEDERELLIQKSITSFPELVDIQDQPANKIHFDTTYGGFEMTHAARLDIPRYLDASRNFFSREATFFESEINPETDLQVEEEALLIPKLELSTSRVIFCQGFAGSQNHWFQTVPFDAVKGEILTIRIPGLNESKVMHRGIWLTAIGNDIYRVGATYDRDNLDMKPTIAGKDELCDRLSKFVRLPFEVIDQQAAVRPVIVGRKPIIGFHPDLPQIGFFNGLGSKGSLQSPWFAQLFAKAITQKMEVPPEFDVAQYYLR